MERRLRVLGLVSLSLLLGCGPPGLVPVQGTVKFPDGTVPQGEFSSVTFQPLETKSDSKGASGDIAADGTFRLMTMNPGDGAYPGEYKVIVNVFKGYPKRIPLVHSKFMDANQTPLLAKVEKGKPNQFDFVVELPEPVKPGAK